MSALAELRRTWDAGLRNTLEQLDALNAQISNLADKLPN